MPTSTGVRLEEGQWMPMPPMCVGREGFGLVAAGGYLIAVGGRTTDEDGDSVRHALESEADQLLLVVCICCG